MPLARIDLPQSIEEDQRAAIGDIVYQTMGDVLNVPAGDKFQIITVHDDASLRIDPTAPALQRDISIEGNAPWRRTTGTL